MARSRNQDTEAEIARAAAEIGSRCLGLRTRVVDRAITSVFSQALRPTGIRSTQLSVLAAVISNGEVGPGDLSRWLHLEKSTVSRTVDRMIDAGWLEPAPAQDGRSYRVVATKAGQAKLVEATQAWARAQAQVEALMGPELAAQLRALAGRLTSSPTP